MTRLHWLLRVLDGLLLIGIAVFVFAGMDAVPFHGDESSLIWMSQDYDLILYEGKSEAVTFQLPPVDSARQFQRVLTGSVTPLTIGLARDIAGLGPDTLNTNWQWQPARDGSDRQWQTNLRAGAVPSPTLLHVARIPSTLFTALSAAVVLAVLLSITATLPALARHTAAWAGTLLYITSPTVLVNGRRAMQEGPLLFFGALVILMALRAIITVRAPSPSRRPITGWLILLGICGGAAMASKHTAVLMFGPALATVWLAPLFNRRGAGVPEGVAFTWQHTFGVVGAGLLGLLVFALLMPVWWFWPHMVVIGGLAAIAFTFSLKSAGLRRWGPLAAAVLAIFVAFDAAPLVFAELAGFPGYMLAERADLIDIQRGPYGSSPIQMRAATLVDQAFFAPAQYYEDSDWANFPVITAQIAAYEDSDLAGWTGPVRAAILIGLGVIGLATSLRRWRDARRFLIALWLLAGIGAMLANPLPWQRYYLILVAPLAVYDGLGLAALLAGVITRLRPAPESAPPQTR